MSNELTKDLRIDPEQLDICAIEQPEKHFKWSQRAIEAKKNEGEVKLEFDVVEAQIQSEIRKSPESYGLKKSTETAISAAVKKQKEYQEMNTKYLEARETTAILQSAAGAMEQRKRMIELLVTLLGQQYFAGPNVPRDLVELWRKQNDGEGRLAVKKQRKASTRKRGELKK